MVTVSAECGSVLYVLFQTTFSSWMQSHSQGTFSLQGFITVSGKHGTTGWLPRPSSFLMEKQKIWLTALSSTMDALHLQLVWWSTWQLYFTHLLLLSWVQIHLALASCPDPQSMEKNGIPALPSIHDNPIYLTDALKLLPDPSSYMDSELQVATENLFLQLWVWPWWSLILSPVFPLSCTTSVRLRTSRLWSTTVTAWSSCGLFIRITMGAPNHKMLAGI